MPVGAAIIGFANDSFLGWIADILFTDEKLGLDPRPAGFDSGDPWLSLIGFSAPKETNGFPKSLFAEFSFELFRLGLNVTG